MPTAQSRITELLEKSKEWCTQSEIAEALNIVSSRCSVDLKALIEQGTITAVKPPPGRNRGAQAIYNIAGVAAPEGSQPYAPRKTPGKPKKPPKLKGFKAAARAAKKRATASAKPAPAALRLHPETHTDPATPPRWALTDKGTLLLVENGQEISKPATRSLIAFVRLIDDFARLIEGALA
jgi:hypothetical protein